VTILDENHNPPEEFPSFGSRYNQALFFPTPFERDYMEVGNDVKEERVNPERFLF